MLTGIGSIDTSGIGTLAEIKKLIERKSAKVPP